MSDSKTKEIDDNLPDILHDAVRQYMKTCDNGLIAAFHYKKTIEIVKALESEVSRLKSEISDTPEKSDAEIGRDAILESIPECMKLSDSGTMIYIDDLERYANNPTKSTGGSDGK